jgi:hypothetical protein
MRFVAVAGLAFIAAGAVAFGATAYRYSVVGDLLKELFVCEVVMSAKKPQFLGAKARMLLFDAVLTSSSDDGLKNEVRRHAALPEKNC